MKIFAVLLTAVLCFFPFCGAVAGLTQTQLEALSAKAAAKNFPQADKVLLYDVEKHVYQPDGLGTVTDECYEKALTEKGREELRSLSIQYSTHYRKVEIPLIEVIRPDGTVRKIDVAANSREAVSTGSMGANIYDPAGKILTVNIPDLAVGDIVHYIIRQQDIRVRVPKHWSDIFLLQYDIPILHYEICVDAPKSLPLRAIEVKDEVKGTLSVARKETKDRILYTWKAENVPQVIAEPYMPPLYTCVQRVLVSTSPDWQEISRWYWKLCLPHLKMTPEIRKKTAELIKGKKDFDARVMAVFQFVSQQIRYMGITAETEAPGLEPHDVSLTFNNRYGVCRDKAVLLVVMLREAGFNAFPALFMAGEPKDHEVANSYFNHAIVAVEKSKGNYLLMDPTDESTADLLPSYLSNMSYLVARPEGETLLRSSVVAVEKNMLDIRSTAAVAADNVLTGETVFTFGGVNDQLYRDAFSHWMSEEREQFFSRILRRALPGAELTSCRILPENVRNMSEPLRAVLKYRLPQALKPGAEEFILPMPEFSSTMGAAALFVERQMGLAARKFPMRFFSTCGVGEKAELTLPPQYRSVYLPSKQQLAVPGLLDYSKEYRNEAGKFIMQRSFRLCGVEVSSTDYLKLKKAFQEIAAAKVLPMVQLFYPEKMTLQEAVKLFPQAGVVALEEENQYELDDNRNWKSLQKFRFMVLNYSGMKNYSEMKFHYNPVRDLIKVTATVHLPDGSSRKLSEKEINIMDAPWVSSAPRYPAGKIMVVSFPGVMPGAVIEGELSRVCRGKPFFNITVPWIEDIPVIRKRLSVIAPEKMKLHYSANVAGAEFVKTAPDRNGMVRMTWTGRSVAALPQETDQPPAWMFVPTVFVSGGNLADYGREVDAALKKAVAASDKKAVQTALAGMETVLTASNSRERELQKIRYIRDLFSKSILKVGPDLNELSVTAFSPAQETLRSGYGSSADCAVLLAAALEHAKIAYRFVAATDVPVLAAVQQKLAQYPQELFSKVLLYLPQHGIYLNDTDHFAPLGSVSHVERYGLELASGQLRAIRPDRNGIDRDIWNFQIKLEADGDVSMQVTRRGTGRFAASFRKFYTNTLPERLKLHFQQMASDVRQGAEIIRKPSVNLDDPDAVTVQFDLKVPKYAVAEGGYIQFELPNMKQLSDRVKSGKAQRETPGFRTEHKRVEVSYRILLPEGVKVVSPRPRRRVWGGYPRGRYQETFEVFRNELLLGFVMNLPVEIIAPQDYGRMVQLERRLLDPAIRYIILKQEKTK